MSDADREEDIAALRELSDGEFTEVIIESFQAPEDWAVLLDLAIVERTVTILDRLRKQAAEAEDELHRTLHEAVEARRFVPGLKADISAAVAHKRKLNHRYGEAYRVLRAARTAKHAALTAVARERRKNARDDHAAVMEAQADAHRQAIRRLTLAIQEHRLAAVAAGLTPEPADRALWALLDEIEVPLGGQIVTLTEMLGRGVWTAGKGAA